MKKFAIPAILVVILGLYIGYGGAGSPVGADPSLYGDDWRIERAGKTPYLVQNGMPAFGRFTTDRPRVNLDGKWKFKLDNGKGIPAADESGWMPINTPGVWNYLRPDLLNYIGPAWYMKTFSVPPEWKGRDIRLYFGGVNMRCRVWLNSSLLGGHEGGYTPFSFDATNHVVYDGPNYLLAQVDNRLTFESVPPANYEGSRMGWWEYGGIHREVYLEALPSVAVFKIHAQTAPLKDNRWAVKATALFRDRRANPGPEGVAVEGLLADDTSLEAEPNPIVLRPAETFSGPKGIWGITFEGEMENPKLWSPETPSNGYLFHVNVRMPAGDEGGESEFAEARFGVRKFEARPNGLFLNNKPYYIRGINRHEDDPETGLAETEYTMRRDIDLLKQLKVNHMRTAHYPNDPRWYDLTDREGIGITEEIPLYQAGVGFTIWLRDKAQRHQNTGKLRFLKTGPWQFEAPQLVRNASLTLIEMIERDINHPSILAWSIGNENWTLGAKPRKTYEALKQVAGEFDPDRPVTFALLTMPEISERMEQTADIADFISINEYFGWYFGKVEELPPFLVKMHRRFPDRPMIVSEFGADAVMDLSKVRPGRRDGQGTFHPEDQAKLIADQWAYIRSLPFMSGAMVWVLSDFRCGWFKEEHPTPYFNGKGVLTYDREPKASFFVLRDIYTDLANRPPARPR